MKPIAICGAGGFGIEVLMLIRQINDISTEWNVIGFFDDKRPKGELIHAVPVLGNTREINDYPEDIFITLALGNSQQRKKIHDSINNQHISYATLIHPSVQIAPYQQCTIGEGCIITAGNILTVDINIGNHVLINLGCTCGHNVIMQDYVSIMPGCKISGNVTIGEGAFLGTGSSIVNNVMLGSFSTIGAGAVVLNNVEENSIVVGVPAKPIEK